MRAIFISYRRDDTEGYAGRLFRDLCERFGDDAVFLDVAGIELGRDFRVAIDQQVASCGVLLAVIGTHWLTATDSEGKRRLDDPFDFVRLETAAALRREIPVIPVLVHEAQMPRPEQLPDDLKELAFRNSMSLSHTRWDSDVELLARALGQFVQRPVGNGAAVPHAAPEPVAVPVVPEAPAVSAARRKSTAKTLGLVTLVIGLVGGGYAMFDRTRKQADAAAEVQRVATVQAEARAAQEAIARAAAEQQARERDEALAQAKTDAAAARDEAAHAKAEAERRAGEREAALARQMAATDKALRDKTQAAQVAEAARAAQAVQIAAATAAAARAAPVVASPGNGSTQITAASCRLIANGVYRVDFAGTARTTGTAFLFTGSDGLANAQPQPKIALGCGTWVRASNACTHAPNQPAETRWLAQREVSFSQMPTYVKAGLFRDATHSTEGKLAEARFAVTCH